MSFDDKFEVDTRGIDEVFPPLDCPIQVTGNKVLVQLRRTHTKTKSGLILTPETIREMKYDEVIAKVVRLGPLAYHSRNDDGFLVPWAEGPWCAVGDLVRTIKFGGDRWSVPYDDGFIHYIIVHDREIIARIPSYDDAPSYGSILLRKNLMPDEIENKDGSAVVAIPEEKQPDIEVLEESIESEAQADNQASADDDAHDDEEAKRAEERRKANRERREKQKLARDSDKARIASQERTINELTERLAKVENTQESMRLSRMDNAIERQERLITAIKQKIATTEDRIEHSDLIDRLADEKLKLRDLQSQKKLTIDNVKQSKNNVPDDKRARTDMLMRDWMDRTPWFDPKGSGVDTRIATVVDEELVKEGWNPATEEYWDELDARLAERLPHRYKQQVRRTPPVTATRNETRSNSNNVGANQFYISKERKQALIDAGVWDNPNERVRYIKQFQKYDRENQQ